MVGRGAGAAGSLMPNVNTTSSDLRQMNFFTDARLISYGTAWGGTSQYRLERAGSTALRPYIDVDWGCRGCGTCTSHTRKGGARVRFDVIEW